MSSGTVAVLLGPGTDPTRRGLVHPAPGRLARLVDWIEGWATHLDVEARCEEVDASRCADRLAEVVADGVVVLAGDAAFDDPRVGAATATRAGPVVDLHLRDLTRRGPEPRTSFLARHGARVMHGRGIDGAWWALHHLAWTLAWPSSTRTYGRHPEQVVEVREPDRAQRAGAGPVPDPDTAGADGPLSTVVLLHGGFWLAPWERDLMDGLAVDLAQRGARTWNAEYRRIDTDGEWPGCGADALAVLTAADRARGPGDPPVMVVGHSAGGQLALWAAGQPTAPPLEAVIALAPLADLANAGDLGGGALERMLAGADPGRACPTGAVPTEVPLTLVHGVDDDLVPVSQSRAYATVARAAGAIVQLDERGDADHFSLVSPGAGWLDVFADTDR
ncbi:alpha/beta hydrolase [Egibacter rhizosphaerae]|uniref:3-dehydroquinate dehydratase n=1 Tax=Egibacter rhizosphaerae TaxID=1670831 RepID=A0A411YF11_9ACTN|nr:alpha/beta hydrolase [Egibacter rhizosphaerae]QBI19843.1 alpha/beta hydrolase [Egibacter rhizosphaerae]